jgi:hypothetical protein
MKRREFITYLGCTIFTGLPAARAQQKPAGVLTLPEQLKLPKAVFFDDFNSMNTIDMANDRKDGHKWYRHHWWQNDAALTPVEAISIKDSIATLTGSLFSGTRSYREPFFHGNAFGGDGRPYLFEAKLAFDPALGHLAQSFPAFWGVDKLHIGNDKALQWPRQAPAYTHWIELDFFEAYRGAYKDYTGFTTYLGTITDWSGIYGAQGFPGRILNNGNKTIKVGAVDWNEFHEYACLVQPQVGDTPGYCQWFFDRKGGPSIYWKGPIGDPPLPTDGANSFTPNTAEKADRTYAIINDRALAFCLQVPAQWPMRVDWVRVSTKA